MIKIKKQNSGFTLIELMIGLVLTSLFIGGVSKVFISISQNFKTQSTLSYMMEDARFVLDKFNSEFRRTGFLSNRLISTDNMTFPLLKIDSTAGVYSFRNAAAGGAATGTLLTMVAGQAVAGATNLIAVPVSDNVVIRYQLTSGADFEGNQLSPCTNGFTFADGVGGETNADRHVVSIVFYMADSAAAGSNVLFCRAYRENLDTGSTETVNAATPLISNVERLRVLYGETDGIATVYRAEDEVIDWTLVESVRLSIALRSEETNVSVGAPGNYILNGKLSIAPTDAADKRLYRVFSTTVAFR